MIKRISSLLILLLLAANSTWAEWENLDSQHFIIYSEPDSADFSQKVAEKAEEYYRLIIDDLGFKQENSYLKDKRMKIYIYKNQEEYIQETNQPSWSFGCVDYKTRTISGFRFANGFLFQVLPHELGHIVLREFVGFNPNIPSWLDEGVAGFVEPGRLWASKSVIRKSLLDRTFIPLDKLSEVNIHQETDSDKVALFYAESVNLVDFLIKNFGKEKFTQFCLGFKEWSTFDEVVSKYYPYKDIKELNQAWLESF